MNGSWVIAKKDLRNIFLSPLFYVLSGLCSLVWSLMFFTSVREFVSQSMFQMAQGGEGSSLHFTVISRHISLVNLFMIFAVAAFTMRLFAEEKKNRTFDLLLTSPVSASQIVLGKLIAGVITAWMMVVISGLYPLSLALFGKLDWGPLAASYIGLLLISAVYVSVGMFASSLTQSSVLAVIMALIFSVLLWFIGAAADVAEESASHEIFNHLNVGTHFVNFLKGNISIAGLVFFLSVIFMFSFLTQRVVESSRWR